MLPHLIGVLSQRNTRDSWYPPVYQYITAYMWDGPFIRVASRGLATQTDPNGTVAGILTANGKDDVPVYVSAIMQPAVAVTPLTCRAD
jgi:hypothetical protein